VNRLTEEQRAERARPAPTEAEQRAQHAPGYDLSKIVAKRWHYCIREFHGITCKGDCETALAEVTDNPCDKNGTRDGFVCLNCGRWSERIADIPHRFATCVPYVGPVRRGRR